MDALQKSRRHPLYMAATIAQAELARLRSLGAPVDDRVVARLDDARRAHVYPHAVFSDLSLFEQALEDMEIDL